MKSSAVSVFALTLAACAPSMPPGLPNPPPQPVNTDAMAATTLAYNACLDRNAARLDDHKSDAATIAEAIQADCFAEGEAVLVAFAQGIAPVAAHRLREGMRNDMTRFAIEAVLRERASRSENSN
jgi:hypothetical protein